MWTRRPTLGVQSTPAQYIYFFTIWILHFSKFFRYINGMYDIFQFPTCWIRQWVLLDELLLWHLSSLQKIHHSSWTHSPCPPTAASLIVMLYHSSTCAGLALLELRLCSCTCSLPVVSSTLSNFKPHFLKYKAVNATGLKAEPPSLGK